MKKILCRNQCGYWVNPKVSYCPWCGINFPVMPRGVFLRRMAIKIFGVIAVFGGLLWMWDWRVALFGTIIFTAFALSSSVPLWNAWDKRGKSKKRPYEDLKDRCAHLLIEVDEIKKSAVQSANGLLGQIQEACQKNWVLIEFKRSLNDVEATLENFTSDEEGLRIRLQVIHDRLTQGRSALSETVMAPWKDLERDIQDVLRTFEAFPSQSDFSPQQKKIRLFKQGFEISPLKIEANLSSQEENLKVFRQRGLT